MKPPSYSRINTVPLVKMAEKMGVYPYILNDFLDITSHEGSKIFTHTIMAKRIPYFFGYKTEIFSFQNNPKDLDLWDCLGRVKLVLLQNFIGLI